MAHQKGFTLLEVMLVMVIIALAAAGVVAMQSDRLSATGKLLRQIDVLRARTAPSWEPSPQWSV